MITKNIDGYTTIEFGNGDICIGGGSQGFTPREVGCLVLVNQEPQEIGFLSARAGTELKPDDTPILLTFTKTESIDVLIRQLKITRKVMNIGRDIDQTCRPSYDSKPIDGPWGPAWETILTFPRSDLDGFSAVGKTKEESLSSLMDKLDSYEDSIHDDIQRALLYFPNDESEDEDE